MKIPLCVNNRETRVENMKTDARTLSPELSILMDGHINKDGQDIPEIRNWTWEPPHE